MGGQPQQDLSFKQVLEYISMRVNRIQEKLHLKENNEAIQFNSDDFLDFIA